MNRGDIGNILITCAQAIPLLLQEYPTASFGLVASRGYDKASRRFEDYQNNQRYRVYKEVISEKIGKSTFHHSAHDNISAYLLINRSCGDIAQKERAIGKMFVDCYNDIHNVQ